MPKANPRVQLQLPSPPIPHNNLDLPTPVRFDRLHFFLSGYNSSIVEQLKEGFTFGFSIHCEGVKPSGKSKNLLSALQNPDVVDVKLEKELRAGRLAGPFKSPPFSTFIVSPLGIVPKKTPGDFRLIHHLSFPAGSSINDGIPENFSSVSYATINDAICQIKLAGRGSFLSKTDIKNAFPIIPISPKDYGLLGMEWKNQFFFDKCMPMGCSSSCRTFEMLSTSLEWVARNKLQIDHILHLLDDFLLIAPSFEVCQAQLKLFLDFCDYVGIPIAPEKTFGPSQILSFAGIELDTVLFEARLPKDKIDKCLATISQFKHRKKVCLRDVQSLIGLLNFACSVVQPGRAFLRRLIDLTAGVRSPFHWIRLTKAVRADLEVWESFLANFNGKSFFLEDQWHNSDHLHLYTDAAASLGYGAVFGSQWCFGVWPRSWTSYNIAVLEFYPIVLSLCLWGHQMSNRRILFFTDNEALVHVINKQSCKDKQLMFYVRKLVFICLQHNILFKAKHIRGIHNCLADSLSRLQISKFHQLAPAGMDQAPTDIPFHLQPQNWQP